MHDYWHIPRASLSSSTSSAISSASSSKSSNRSNKSHSNPPTLSQRGAGAGAENREAAPGTNAAVTAAAAAAVLAAAKRGSRSSQGSSDSNNSTRSAASGSLLLTAANLERFAEIHKKQERQHKMLMNELPDVHGNNYNSNLTLAHNNNSNSSGNNKDAVIPIDPNLNFIKTKDLDTVSIASSMHFTMVNGEGGATKKPKRGLCDRGRQVTVLIVSMSTIFLLLIMGMVYALEMRARDMPKS
ncbi:putative uncharacterized protein DDB_G0277255 [Scaptodrosophila lebanonensis]|uniref:Uncharacterized protein n=1 Tax=Drosophila lebanonensis TaxID=7225 RepID=A0A6J2UAA6_DROLE|nr:putative uncharacterized protein DDB_G0277255 [Scaptodrosophila lebanonensis]